MQTTKQLFTYLNQHRHNTNTEYLPTLFDDTANIPNTEYWLMSDLYNLYGQNIFNINSKNTPEIFMQAHLNFTPLYQQLNNQQNETYTYVARANFYNTHIIIFKPNYSTPIPNNKTTYKHNTQDAKLTRYAIWSVLQKFPNKTIDKLYFIQPNADKLSSMLPHISRIDERKNSINAERALGAIIHQLHIKFGPFYRDMTQVLFCNDSVEELKHINKIKVKEHDPLTNYMDATTLHFRTAAIWKAINEFNNTHYKTPATLSDLTLQQLDSARHQIKQLTGRNPEHSISNISIRAVNNAYNKTERDFIKQYAFTGFQKSK